MTTKSHAPASMFIISDALIAVVCLSVHLSYYTGLFSMSCIMFMHSLYMCITVLPFWRNKEQQ